MEKSRFTPEEEQRIEQEFDKLLSDYRSSLHHGKEDLVRTAFSFANKAHYGVRRMSGEPYILHPLSVARIVVTEIGLGGTSICAALLHDVVEDTEYTVNDIEHLTNPIIAHIVEGLTKISAATFDENKSAQAENFRKLLLTMSDDIRVVLIKIADRLHNMRTLGAQPKAKQYKIAGETQYIYAPLAYRLGLFSIKSELENLSFLYEHPDTYKEISDKLEQVKERQLENFNQFSVPIKAKLTEMGYKFTITARIKSVYSIWKKMQLKKCAFEDVYDLLAARIVFTPLEGLPEKDQCWMIYSAVTDIYRPHPERIRDWISTPKSNGYEALHVTVMSEEGQWVEVQIRTERMHELAEKGLAAHWKYKNGEEGNTELDKWLKQVKDVLANPEPNALDFLDTFKLNLFSQEVYVFTPKGEVKVLPHGATALDLAFDLHSQLGEHCIGAKVNHQLQPLSYQLHGGDQVEILTSNSQWPKEDWLEIVVTAKAQTVLKTYFKRIENSTIRKGESAFMAQLGRLNMTEVKGAALQRMMKTYGLNTPNELYMAIGKGSIPIDNIESIIQDKKKSWWKRLNPFTSTGNTKGVQSAENITEEAVQKETTLSKTDKQKNKKIILTDSNIGKDYHIATCCNPIPGDEILAYQDETGKTIIHKVDCETALSLKAKYGPRIKEASWDTHGLQSFIEKITIRGVDKFGVMINVLTIITTQFHINIRNLNISAENGLFSGTLEVYVNSRKELLELFEALKKMDEILEAGVS